MLCNSSKGCSHICNCNTHHENYAAIIFPVNISIVTKKRVFITPTEVSMFRGDTHIAGSYGKHSSLDNYSYNDPSKNTKTHNWL